MAIWKCFVIQLITKNRSHHLRPNMLVAHLGSWLLEKGGGQKFCDPWERKTLSPSFKHAHATCVVYLANTPVKKSACFEYQSIQMPRHLGKPQTRTLENRNPDTISHSTLLPLSHYKYTIFSPRVARNMPMIYAMFPQMQLYMVTTFPTNVGLTLHARTLRLQNLRLHSISITLHTVFLMTCFELRILSYAAHSVSIYLEAWLYTTFESQRDICKVDMVWSFLALNILVLEGQNMKLSAYRDVYIRLGPDRCKPVPNSCYDPVNEYLIGERQYDRSNTWCGENLRFSGEKHGDPSARRWFRRCHSSNLVLDSNRMRCCKVLRVTKPPPSQVRVPLRLQRIESESQC